MLGMGPATGADLAAVGRQNGEVDLLSCQHGTVHGSIPAQPCDGATRDEGAAVAGLSLWSADGGLRQAMTSAFPFVHRSAGPAVR